MVNPNHYQLEIEKLFVQWKKKKKEDSHINHRDGVFIRDGVVCPEEWFSQTIRPMFLLKEAYSGEKDWDLCKDHLMLKDKRMSNMWLKVSQWTEGLFNTTRESVQTYHNGMSDMNYGNEWLKRIAVVNVKKSGGVKESSMKEINEYAEYDCEELRREIEVCDPTIIICGYTISSLNIIFRQNIKNYHNPDENWIYSMEINNHSVIVIDYYHPVKQFPDLLNYYGLMNIYQLALRRKDNELDIHMV